MNNTHDPIIIRQNAYSFLAGLFLLEPNLENIVEVQRLLNSFLSEDEQLEQLITEPEEVDDLSQEYYDLFFVPSSGTYIPPFESTLKNYNPKKKKPYGRLFDKEALEVQAYYEAVGFVPWELDIFPPLKSIKFPDHIGYELAFMSLLCANERACGENGDKAAQWRNLQHQFLSEHLGKWIGNFARALEHNTEGFYQKAGIAARNWVCDDLEHLAETVIQSKGDLLQ